MKIEDMKTPEIKEYLKKNRGQYAIYWCTDDVIDNAENEGLDIIPNEHQALEILKAALSGHDCNFGVTWELLTYLTQEYFN